MFEFTICFIRQGENILLLNREKPEWMGVWNGVGGKIRLQESPLECILREVKEETGIHLKGGSVQYKGDVTWTNPEGSYYGGMHVFIAELPSEYVFPTPVKTEEGILDWKKKSWILHPKNEGIANLKYFLSVLFDDDKLFQHNFVYRENDVYSFHSTPLKQPLPINE